MKWCPYSSPATIVGDFNSYLKGLRAQASCLQSCMYSPGHQQSSRYLGAEKGKRQSGGWFQVHVSVSVLMCLEDGELIVFALLRMEASTSHM
jgi:hypothetical protein